MVGKRHMLGWHRLSNLEIPFPRLAKGIWHVLLCCEELFERDRWNPTALLEYIWNKETIQLYVQICEICESLWKGTTISIYQD